ncbi:hypothetical protein BDV98DRAFT_574461 [Pterulicium gracile]|uniref:Uncharacterized protein n=1 Tax=Pterulicium gracile TaxID=1884261 RepID=A0A5C3QB78_9AGAR|nr:hypothetical protein BDV98DRAFT_574461 [Pterula gracilis]
MEILRVHTRTRCYSIHCCCYSTPAPYPSTQPLWKQRLGGRDRPSRNRRVERGNCRRRFRSTGHHRLRRRAHRHLRSKIRRYRAQTKKKRRRERSSGCKAYSSHCTNSGCTLCKNCERPRIHLRRRRQRLPSRHCSTHRCRGGKRRPGMLARAMESRD